MSAYVAVFTHSHSNSRKHEHEWYLINTSKRTKTGLFPHHASTSKSLLIPIDGLESK